MEPKPIDGGPIAKWVWNNKDDLWQFALSLAGMFGAGGSVQLPTNTTGNKLLERHLEQAEKESKEPPPKEEPPIRMIDFEL